jgi:hypothetical protein
LINKIFLFFSGKSESVAYAGALVSGIGISMLEKTCGLRIAPKHLPDAYDPSGALAAPGLIDVTEAS